MMTNVTMTGAVMSSSKEKKPKKRKRSGSNTISLLDVLDEAVHQAKKIKLKKSNSNSPTPDMNSKHLS